LPARCSNWLLPWLAPVDELVTVAGSSVCWPGGQIAATLSTIDRAAMMIAVMDCRYQFRYGGYRGGNYPHKNFLVTAGRQGGGGYGRVETGLADPCDRVVECHTENEGFGSWLWPKNTRRRQLFCAPSGSLRPSRARRLLDRHPRFRVGSCGGARWRVLSMGLVVARCFTSARPEVVRTPVACLLILAQAISRLRGEALASSR
jgi:hypothetical protein